MTYREQFDSAMKCQTGEEADAWMAKEIKHYEDDFKKGAEEAHEIILSNLGYMAGYCDESYAKKVFDLFGARHPIFGAPGYHKNISAEKAFQAGVNMALKDGGAQ